MVFDPVDGSAVDPASLGAAVLSDGRLETSGGLDHQQSPCGCVANCS